jgi:hypothetical protein
MFVFPAREKTEWVGPDLYEAKAPYTKRGVSEASNDRARIEKWWAAHPDALVGVNTGKSGYIVLDIDMDAEHGRDGYYYLTSLELDTPETFSYRTPRGGEHRWYADPLGNLGPTQNHVLPDGRRAEGIDRRAGNSYAIWWSDDVPWDRIEAAPPPAWLLTPNQSNSGVAFNGTPQTWLEALNDGEPDERVLSVIERMQDDAPRDDMLKRQRELIGLGAEGHPGVPAALDILRGLWLSRSHVSGDPNYEWSVALLDGVRKFGGTPEPDTTPDKAIAVRVAQEVTDPTLTRMFFDSGSREDRRRFIRGLLRLGYSPDDVFATVWHVPLRGDLTQKKLYQEIHDIVENQGATPTEDGPVSLLTPAERAHVETIYSFVDHYCYAASINQRPWNMAYHRLNAWIILGLMFSDVGWIDIDKGLNLNLYGFQIGPSGSGKSEAMLDMHGFLHHIERYDQISIDDDASEAGLLGALRDRGGEVVWFHGDEAERVLSKMREDSKVAWGGLQGTLTQLYDTGYVPKQLRAASSKEVSREGAVRVKFNVWLDGTEEDLFTNLTVSQVKKGFVARFISAFGEKPERTREDIRTRRRSQTINHEVRDPHLAALAVELNEIRAHLIQTRRGALVPTDEAMHRMDDARIKALELFEGDPLWDVLEPNILRISFVMWKAAGLNAVSQGRTVIEVDDVLVAIRASEEWLANSVRLMRGVRGSDFTGKVEKVFAEIAKTGSISEKGLTARVYGVMALSKRDLTEITENLQAQGRVRLDKGVWRVTKDD